MKIPLIIASGQGVIPFVLIGIPAAVIGSVCLVIAVVFALKKRTEDKKPRTGLLIAGIALWLLAVFSPTLDPIVLPLVERFTGK